MIRSFVARGGLSVTMLVVAIAGSAVGWVYWPKTTPAALPTAAPSAAPPSMMVAATSASSGATAMASSLFPAFDAMPRARPQTGKYAYHSEGAAPFLARKAPQARRGDADAAWEVYSAEAMCASIEKTRTSSSTLAGTHPDLARDLERIRERTIRLCVGVTPAQVEERFGFLDMAVRAGHRDAMLAVRSDPPTGVDPYRPDLQDPRAVAWARLSTQSIETLAAEGNRTAWLSLALDLRLGVLVPRDLRRALVYDAAFEATQKDSGPEVAAILKSSLERNAAALDPEVAKRAVAEGQALAERFPASNR